MGRYPKNREESEDLPYQSFFKAFGEKAFGLIDSCSLLGSNISYLPSIVFFLIFKIKMMQLVLKKITVFITILFLVSSCHKEDVVVVGDYLSGYYVTCEGPFQAGTGTHSFINSDFNVTNNVFEKVNGNASLGNVVQSMHIFDGKGFTIVNNAKKMVVTDANTGKFIYEVTGLAQPRYIVTASSTKAYISQWGNNGSEDTIIVFDLVNKNITNKIKTGKGPEKMLFDQNKLYVANSGGLSYDSTISVINTNTDQIEQKIITSALGPQSIVKDNTGNVWVLCQGSYNVTPFRDGGLFQIVNNKAIKIKDLSIGAKDLQYSSTTNSLYYVVDGTVKQYDLNSKTEKKFTNQSFKNAYCLFVDSKNGKVLVGDAEDYVSNGSVYIFDLQVGNLEKKVIVGIIPSGITKNN
jgi:hypothetical protein